MKTPSAKDEMLNVADSATFIGLKPATVYQWVKERHPDCPPFYRIGSGRRCVLRFRRSDLEQWLERHRVEPAA